MTVAGKESKRCVTPIGNVIPLKDGVCGGRLFAGWASCLHGIEGQRSELMARLAQLELARTDLPCSSCKHTYGTHWRNGFGLTGCVGIKSCKCGGFKPVTEK